MIRMAEQKLAVILLRGTIGASTQQSRTLTQLRLFRKNHCIIVPGSPSFVGMLKVVKDYVTWGEISEELLHELMVRRSEPWLGKEQDDKIDRRNRFMMLDKKRIKPVFRLSPPRGGFERRGIRRSVAQGGALGYRGHDMDKLVRRMM